MSWCTIWHEPHSPFPEHADHADEAAAHAHALATSRRIGGEVAVVEFDIDEGDA